MPKIWDIYATKEAGPLRAHLDVTLNVLGATFFSDFEQFSEQSVAFPPTTPIRNPHFAVIDAWPNRWDFLHCIASVPVSAEKTIHVCVPFKHATEARKRQLIFTLIMPAAMEGRALGRLIGSFEAAGYQFYASESFLGATPDRWEKHYEGRPDAATQAKRLANRPVMAIEWFVPTKRTEELLPVARQQFAEAIKGDLLHISASAQDVEREEDIWMLDHEEDDAEESQMAM